MGPSISTTFSLGTLGIHLVGWGLRDPSLFTITALKVQKERESHVKPRYMPILMNSFPSLSSLKSAYTQALHEIRFSCELRYARWIVFFSNNGRILFSRITSDVIIGMSVQNIGPITPPPSSSIEQVQSQLSKYPKN